MRSEGSVSSSEMGSAHTRGILGVSPDSVEGYLGELNEPAFRARQVMEWIYRHGAGEFAEMTNLSKDLRQRLTDDWTLFESRIINRAESSDGTVKLLLQWRDRSTSECVLIPDGVRRTACISTQVGCPVGCRFCASGIDGLQRQLSAAQIVEQAMRVQKLCAPEDRLSNVVFMGLGEPLANFDATVAAVRAINADWGLNVGARKITVSTVGLAPRIRQLADLKMQITLAISIHAPDDDLRKQLIPWAAATSLDELIDAGRYYFQQTGREVTLEYVLLAGVNDQPDHARRLARLSSRLRSSVNLIPYNPVPELPYRCPSPSAMQSFLLSLREAGINVHLRRSRGLDIDGACGQLRRREALKR